MDDDLLKRIVEVNSSKILLVIMDGLGGLPIPEHGKTELEMANKPRIDEIAMKSALGLHDPIAPGVTPGSGPAHLAIFGYDPVDWEIGRGILAALGIGFAVDSNDLTARGNFATMDDGGKIIDRRAGRITTETNIELCSLLEGIKIGGIEVIVKPVKEHRVAVVFRGKDLSQSLSDSDPQATGVPARAVEALDDDAGSSAEIANAFLKEVNERLAGKQPANTILLRGFAKLPGIPSFESRYKMKACAIATYPMYKGLAKLVGMHVLECGETLESQIKVLSEVWNDYDFFFFHYKKTDSRGEDGNFGEKVKAIEEMDKYISRIFDQQLDVFILTGDHSTPSLLKMHSWHPVPMLMWSRYVIPDELALTEKNCAKGNLGRMRAVEVMPLAMANALRLEKYGA